MKSADDSTALMDAAQASGRLLGHSNERALFDKLQWRSTEHERAEGYERAT